MEWIIGNHFLIKNTTSSESSLSPIPTLVSVAVNVAQKDRTKMSLNQVVTYESVCSIFLLKPANDNENNSMSIGTYFANAARSISFMNSTGSQHNISYKYLLSSKNKCLWIFKYSPCNYSSNSNFSYKSHASSLTSKPQFFSFDQIVYHQNILFLTSINIYACLFPVWHQTSQIVHHQSWLDISIKILRSESWAPCTRTGLYRNNFC